MTALGLDVGSQWTKLAWHDHDEPRTATVRVRRADPEALGVELAAALAGIDLGGPDDVVVVAVPEQWRDEPDSTAAQLKDVIQAVVGDATVQLVGTPVAVASALAESAQSVMRPVVVDVGAGTVEVAVLATESRSEPLPGDARVPPHVRLVRHDHGAAGSAAALKKLFEQRCKPLFGPDRPIDVRIVGGEAEEDWVGAAVRAADALGAKPDVRALEDPRTFAARGALILAAGGLHPAQRYPYPVKAWVGLRRDGHLINEERLLAEADRLEVGAFTTHAILEPGEFLQIEDRSVGDLPRLCVDSVDGPQMLDEPTGPDLPRGRYAAALHLDRHRRCTLLLQPLDEPPGDPFVVEYGALPATASRFPGDLTSDVERIRSWGVRETSHVPRMREVTEALRRTLRENPRLWKLSQRVDGGEYLVDLVLRGGVPQQEWGQSARRLWHTRIKPRWLGINEDIAHPGGLLDMLDDVAAFWGSLCKVDDYLQGVPDVDWPPLTCANSGKLMHH